MSCVRTRYERFICLKDSAADNADAPTMEIQPFHSRSVYSGNSALSFTHMNGDVPLTTSPYHEDGRVERLDLIRTKLPGVDEVVSVAEDCGENRFSTPAVFHWPGSALIPELALKLRAVETAAALLAVVPCATTIVTRSPICMAL